MKNASLALREENDQLRELVRQLTEQLASTSFQFPREFDLTPTQTAIVRHLMTRDVITRRSTMMLLYSDRAGDEPDQINIDMQIGRIRRKLKPHHIEIETVWGRGWRIVDRDSIAERFK